MNIEAQITRFIQQNLYFAEDNTLTVDASFLATGVVDSMGIMELVTFAQTEFGITVRSEEVVVENFDSVRQLAAFIRRKLAPPGPEQAPAAANVPAAPVPTTHR